MVVVLPFSVEHALDCCDGGLVAQHHNEVRDAIGDLSESNSERACCL